MSELAVRNPTSGEVTAAEHQCSESDKHTRCAMIERGHSAAFNDVDSRLSASTRLLSEAGCVKAGWLVLVITQASRLLLNVRACVVPEDILAG